MNRSARAGLVVLGVLSVLDLIGPLTTDGEHPPMGIALVGSLLGLVSLALVVSAWRGARRAVLPLVVLRGLSALTAVPALFVDGVPGPIVLLVAVGLVVTVAAIVAVVAGARRPVAEVLP
jgi:hypothetical protein